MKKIISTLILGLACTIGVQAQEYNLFYDVDADGWLWFDSQELTRMAKSFKWYRQTSLPIILPLMPTRSGKVPEKAVKSAQKVSVREPSSQRPHRLV